MRTRHSDDQDQTRRLLGAPVELRRPSLDRVRQRWWNTDDPRVFVPRVWGWGWDLNLRALLRRARPAELGAERSRRR